MISSYFVMNNDIWWHTINYRVRRYRARSRHMKRFFHNPLNERTIKLLTGLLGGGVVSQSVRIQNWHSRSPRVCCICRSPELHFRTMMTLTTIHIPSSFLTTSRFFRVSHDGDQRDVQIHSHILCFFFVDSCLFPRNNALARYEETVNTNMFLLIEGNVGQFADSNSYDVFSKQFACITVATGSKLSSKTETLFF